MRPNELRIGNYILGIYNEEDEDGEELEYGEECQVGTLDTFDQTEYSIWVEGKSNRERYDDFIPIPLTEQWLIDFGFESNGQGLFDKYTGHLNFWQFTIYVSKTGMVLRQPVSLKVYHVHQLQNLFFALTGEELKRKEATNA